MRLRIVFTSPATKLREHAMALFDSGQPAFESLAEIVGGHIRPFVYFIGAGLSQQAGLPSWRQLRQQLEDKATRFVATLSDRESLTVRLNNAKRESDYWTVFEQLRAILGPAEYRAAIRDALSESERCPIPSGYLEARKLNYRGVLSLNLDRLASRAFASHPAEPPLSSFTGKVAAAHSSVLDGPPRFLAQLHGTLDDDSSWVLTSSDLADLRTTQGYSRFIEHCMSRFTLVFLGITVDDIAVGGPLSDLATDGFQPSEHFWITDRTDLTTDRWAQTRNVRVIRYDSTSGDHSALTECLQLLASQVPSERPTHPVIPPADARSANPLPTPTDILQLDDDMIRRLLNAEAARILEDSNAAAMEKYQHFLRIYDKAVYRAWYINSDPPNNTIFGYTLHEHIADGAFGAVYRAVTPDGDTCAVKILNQSIRKQPGRLQSFRRGVEAMKILSGSNVNGMVGYRFATELPAIAVMEFVDGLNLQEFVEAGFVSDWPTALRIGVDLCRIVRSAHTLPQRVLHRDIRPANVMIKNATGSEQDWSVVVLDFDLCWYLDAGGMSIEEQSSSLGYLAPEIVAREAGVSTRSALIDSFGLGMTLYYLRTSLDPSASEHRGQSWYRDLFSRIEKYPCARWRSVPRRFARLIHGATKHRQSERLDMAWLETELQRLRTAERTPDQVTSTDLVAEEIAIRTSVMRQYTYNIDSSSMHCSFPTGVSVTLTPEDISSTVVLEVNWEATGVEHRTGLQKYVPAKVDRARSILQRCGWTNFGGTTQHKRVSIRARMDVQAAVSDLDGVANGMDLAIAELSFA